MPSPACLMLASFDAACARTAPADSGQEALAALSPREREILALIGEGLTNRQTGKQLYLSEKTVKNNVSRLPAKLGVERRAGRPNAQDLLPLPSSAGRREAWSRTA